MYFLIDGHLYRANFGATPDTDGIPLGSRYVAPPHLVHDALDLARENVKDFEERQDLIKRWSEYLNINHYAAQNDIDTISLKFGESLAREYIVLRLTGSAKSLHDFAKDHGIITSWEI